MPDKFRDLSHAIEAQGETGVMTDQWLLPKFFKLTQGTEVHLVATDSFIGKSKDQYNAAWLSRELIQNFVDHNPDDQGTLNGVEIITEELPKSKEMPKGGKRITIKGNWKFENPTGVISPHSEKPADTETAGGNGIGLKQSALRMLRDFGAKKFEIEGEGWKVDYGMIKKDEVNQKIQENLPQMPAARIHHDWLVADLSKTQNRGTNSYVIETDNPELIASLTELPNLGVSKQNKYLQNLDLDVQTGNKQSIALKWLQPGEDGRLFINGQVMNYEQNGASSDDYWRGPEGLSVSLKGVKYKMSIDRPPVGQYDFDSYLDRFTKELTTVQLIDQLKKSSHLWKGTIKAGYREPGFIVVVKNIIDELKKRKDFKPAQFKELFPEKLLANDAQLKIDGKEIKKLQQEEYIICDEIFGKIGMDKVSNVLKPDERLILESLPGDPSEKIKKIAEETGLQVYFEEYERLNVQDFIRKISEFVKKYQAKMEVTDDGIKITIPEGINTKVLYAQIPHPKKNNTGQQLLFELRSLIQHGLQNGLFDEHSHTSNIDVLTTYKSGISFACDDREQILIIRNTRVRSEQFTREVLPLEASLKFGKKLTAEQVNDILIKISQTPVSEQQRINLTQPNKPTDSIVVLNSSRKPSKNSSGDFYTPTPPQSSWFKRTLLVLGGIGAIGAGVHEISSAPDVVAVGNKDVGDTPNKNTREDENHSDQLEKQRAANEKFARFINQNPGALIDGSDLGKTNVGEVGKRTANVEPASHDVNEGARALEQNEMADQIEDFEPLAEITPKQAEQFKMLTSYLELTTNVKLSGIKFFVFKGKGALGVNHGGKFIGLHEAMFETDFFEALSTMIHEVAHSDPDSHGHDDHFRHTMQDLFSAALQTEHTENNPNSAESAFRTRWNELSTTK